MTDVGLNEADAPAGSPATENDTVPVKPVPGVMVAEYVVAPPCATACEVGVALSEKLGGPMTVIVRVGGFGSVIPKLSVTVSVAA